MKLRFRAFTVLILPLLTAISSAQPVATLNGQPIDEKDLAASMEGQMRQLRRQEYEVKLGALEAVINQRLVEAEARAKGVSAEKLMAEEVEAKAPPPTDEEVEAYYLGQKDRINRPLEAVKEQLRQGLGQVKLQQVREQFHRRLREKAKVSILLRPPKVEVAIDASRVRGDPRAPVTIVEFSDFQCPFCQRIQPTLLEILARYPGKVRLAYRDYPLSQIHPRAQKAAEAARCAGEQGKFWEYHDMLYADVSRLADADLAAHARSLEIDEAKFGACLESGRHSAGVDQDQKDGVNAGVNGTPAFLVNGVMLEGAQPITAFESIIESELAALKTGQ